MGTGERSDRARHLRRSVHAAVQRGRQQHKGRLSGMLLALQAPLLREGLTKDDLYRAAREDQIDKLSLSKLARLQSLFERCGLAVPAAAQGTELQRAILGLSGLARPPEIFRLALPLNYFCLRQSYLSAGMINVSYVEMTVEEDILRYRETRAGSLGASSQRAVLEGTVLHHDGPEALYYVLGLNEFRTTFAVEEVTSVHANLVSLSILRTGGVEGFGLFQGLHLSVMPANSALHPGAPYAARLLLIQTRQTLAQAAKKGLIQNHEVRGVCDHKGWAAAERRLIQKHMESALLSGQAGGHGGLLVLPDRPVAARKGRNP